MAGEITDEGVDAEFVAQMREFCPEFWIALYLGFLFGRELFHDRLDSLHCLADLISPPSSSCFRILPERAGVSFHGARARISGLCSFDFINQMIRIGHANI